MANTTIAATSSSSAVRFSSILLSLMSFHLTIYFSSPFTPCPVACPQVSLSPGVRRLLRRFIGAKARAAAASASPEASVVSSTASSAAAAAVASVVTAPLRAGRLLATPVSTLPTPPPICLRPHRRRRRTSTPPSKLPEWRRRRQPVAVVEACRISTALRPTFTHNCSSFLGEWVILRN